MSFLTTPAFLKEASTGAAATGGGGGGINLASPPLVVDENVMGGRRLRTPAAAKKDRRRMGDDLTASTDTAHRPGLTMLVRYNGFFPAPSLATGPGLFAQLQSDTARVKERRRNPEPARHSSLNTFNGLRPQWGVHFFSWGFSAYLDVSQREKEGGSFIERSRMAEILGRAE
jgi:hypothetical protein